MGSRNQEMEQALSYLLQLLRDSEPSAYASRLPADLIQVVSANLRSVKSAGYLVNPAAITEMFLPTASLQDIAMDNGWGSQYLELSSYFDREILNARWLRQAVV